MIGGLAGVVLSMEGSDLGVIGGVGRSWKGGKGEGGLRSAACGDCLFVSY